LWGRTSTASGGFSLMDLRLAGFSAEALEGAEPPGTARAMVGHGGPWWV